MHHTAWKIQKYNNKYKHATIDTNSNKLQQHIQNNHSVRDMLGQRGIRPEQLPAEEDLKKLERRVKADEKKLAKNTKGLPPESDKE